MTRRAHLLAAAAIAMVTFAAPARAEDVAAWGDGVEVMADGEMSDLRGGLRLPNGIDVGFGAVVTTYANGVPVLETTLTWSQAGALLSSSIGSLGQSIDSLTPQQRSALGLDGLEGLGGVVIADAAGVTALVHNVTKGALQNIIINNATGRDLNQTMDVQLALPDFSTAQEAFGRDLLGMRIGDDMRNQLAAARP